MILGKQDVRLGDGQNWLRITMVGCGILNLQVILLQNELPRIC